MSSSPVSRPRLSQIPALAATAVTALAALLAPATEARAALVWDWAYSGSGISASGQFETQDAPDANGAYTIVAIHGQRNGEAIIGLQTTGTAIPGNEPYAVDNLVSLAGGQLTHYGFGYQTASGLHANPYLADWLAVPLTYEVLTSPPYAGMTHELPVSFEAHIAAVPEPGALALSLLALLSLGLAMQGRRHAAPQVKAMAPAGVRPTTR
ncbi:MAG: hypothetical protein RLY78_3770 [Pseudomonadota bacterium]